MKLKIKRKHGRTTKMTQVKRELTSEDIEAGYTEVWQEADEINDEDLEATSEFCDREGI